ANRNKPWRLGELAKGQVNLSPTHLVNVEMLVNQFHSENANLSEVNPLGTAPELKQDVYLLTAKDQVFRANGLMVETGLAASRFRSAVLPHGDLPYQLVPGMARGSFFKTSNVVATRLQGLMNVTLSPAQWRGRPEVKLRADLDRGGSCRLR